MNSFFTSLWVRRGQSFVFFMVLVSLLYGLDPNLPSRGNTRPPFKLVSEKLAVEQLTLNAPEAAMVGDSVRLQLTNGDSPSAGAKVRVTGPAQMLAVVTARDGLNVRVEPNSTSATKGLIYPQDGALLVLSTTADGWHHVMLQSGDTGYVSALFTDKQPFGQPLGTTNEQGILVTDKLAVVPSVIEIAAVTVDGASTSTTLKVVPFQYDRSEQVATGVTYRERRFVRSDHDLFTMQILEVDPSNPYVDLLPVLANDRVIEKETTSSISRRYGATAAINGGYFVVTGSYAGDPSGAYMLNKKIVSEGSGRTALLLCTEERQREQVEMDVVAYAGRITTSDTATLNINGVNRTRNMNEMIVFRSIFGPSTLTNTSGVEAVLDAEQRVVSLEDGTGNAAIPKGGAVLSGHGAAAAWLREHARIGTIISIEERFSPRTLPGENGCNIQDIVGGGSRLVTNGIVTVTAPGEVSFGHEGTRNPRTAFGVTNTGAFLFVTVDGRQPNKSVGMRLDELASEMIALGALQAMNLDGGGSTTMVVNDQVRNTPSDPGGVERPVSDGLLIFSKGTLADLTKLLDPLVADHNQIDPSIEKTLRKRIRAATVMIKRGNFQSASKHLRRLRQILDAEEEKRLSSAAAELLRETIDAVLEVWQARTGESAVSNK